MSLVVAHIRGERGCICYTHEPSWKLPPIVNCLNQLEVDKLQILCISDKKGYMEYAPFVEYEDLAEFISMLSSWDISQKKGEGYKAKQDMERMVALEDIRNSCLEKINRNSAV